MSCQPELVTGYVDGALAVDERERIAAHLRDCAECRAQADQERMIRARLRELPPPEPRPGLENDLRAGLRRRRPGRLRVLLPLAAAALAIAVLWLRGSPAAVARVVVFDHVKCFRHERPPAHIFSHDASEVGSWFGNQGTSMPQLPARIAGLVLEGARYCPLLDGTSVAHVYYRDSHRHVSLFVIPRALRLETELTTNAFGRSVRLLGREDQTLAVVGESGDDVDKLSAALLTRSASVVR